VASEASPSAVRSAAARSKCWPALSAWPRLASHSASLRCSSHGSAFAALAATLCAGGVIASASDTHVLRAGHSLKLRCRIHRFDGVDGMRADDLDHKEPLFDSNARAAARERGQTIACLNSHENAQCRSYVGRSLDPRAHSLPAGRGLVGPGRHAARARDSGLRIGGASDAARAGRAQQTAWDGQRSRVDAGAHRYPQSPAPAEPTSPGCAR